MTALFKRLSLLAVLVAVLAVAASAAGGTEAARTSSVAPTLYVLYAMNCTFTIVDDTGKTVTAIAPGNYQVDVRTPIAFGTLPKNYSDMTACRGMAQFQLTGPGVSYVTTLTGGCEADDVATETFLPNATYSAQDLNQPSVAHGSFTTLASGTPSSVAAGYSSTSLGKTSLSTDIVGSGLHATRGMLVAKLSAAGVPTLTRLGKSVTTLAAGRYTFAVTDQDTKGSFSILGPKSRVTTKLTGAGFVGKRSVTVNLTSGRWAYFAVLRHFRYFVVTG
jgi:hypothetical protein